MSYEEGGRAADDRQQTLKNDAMGGVCPVRWEQAIGALHFANGQQMSSRPAVATIGQERRTPVADLWPAGTGYYAGHS